MAATQVAACPHCEAKLKVQATSAGKQVRCPKCGKPFAVRAAEDEGLRPSRSAAVPRAKPLTGRNGDDDTRPQRNVGRHRDNDEDDDDDDDRPRKKSGSSGNKTLLILLLVGGAGFVLLLLLAGGVVATILIIRANKDSSSSVASDSGSSSGSGTLPQTDFGKHEAAKKEMIAQLNAVAEAMEAVKDQNSAKTAAVKMNQVSDRLAEVAKQVPTLPKLSPSEDAELHKKYDPDLKKASTRMQTALARAGQNSGGDPDFINALVRLQNVYVSLPPVPG